MNKLFRHKWIPQDGFRVDKCERCSLIRYWDSGFGKLMYKWIEDGIENVGYTAPKCKRIMHCDKIEVV